MQRNKIREKSTRNLIKKKHNLFLAAKEMVNNSKQFIQDEIGNIDEIEDIGMNEVSDSELLIVDFTDDGSKCEYGDEDEDDVASDQPLDDTPLD